MKSVAVVLAFAVAFLVAGPVLAHEGHDHKIMGTVAAIDAKHIDVTTQDEHKTTIWLDGETKILRGKSQTTAGDVKVGERVVVTAIEKEGKMLAREVLLASAAR